MVEEGVKYISTPGQALLAIVGAGGIGKTSIALHINDSQDVKDKYTGETHFLPCEVLPNEESLLQGIIQRLHIQVQQGDSQHQKLTAHFNLNRDPVLFILDNFETPWIQDQVNVENTLRKLGEFKHISIIITTRISGQLKGLAWKTLGSKPIPALDEQSAMEAFMQTAEKSDFGEDIGIAKTLLKELDYFPLAINLIGRMAGELPIKTLYDSWKESKTAMLTDMKGDGRLTSVEVSIEMSTTLLKAHEEELLAIICYLPNGVPDWSSHLSEMLPNFKNLLMSIRNLLKYSLIQEQGKDIRVLAPIREYICKKSPNLTYDIASLESFYISLLKDPSRQGQEKQDGIQPHFLNITQILNDQIKLSLGMRHIEAINIMVNFTVFYPLTLHVIDGILNTFSDLEEEYRVDLEFKRLCMLRWMAKWDDGTAEAERMRKSKPNDVQYNAKVFQQLGEIQWMQNNNSEATEMFTKAKNQFESIEDQLGAVQCLESMGNIQRLQSNYNEATAMLTSAKEQFESIGDQLGAAQCLQNLGDIQRMQANYSEATEMLTRAKEQFEGLGGQRGAAQCLRSLGDIQRMQDNYSEACAMLTQAKEQFERIGDQLGAAQCLQRLGDIQWILGNYSEANDMLSRAKEQFEGIGDQLDAAQCLRSLGEIQKEEGNYNEAIAIITRAKEQFESIGHLYGLADCLYTLAIVYTKQELHPEAKSTLENAITHFQKIGNMQRDIAWCLYQYGWIFKYELKFKEAREKFEEARDTFSRGAFQKQVDMCKRRLTELDEHDESSEDDQ